MTLDYTSHPAELVEGGVRLAVSKSNEEFSLTFS